MIVFYDLGRKHQYLSDMYFDPLRKYLTSNGISWWDREELTTVRNSPVLLLADHLTEETISVLKNNNNKIVGFSVTDSSYVSQCCRAGEALQQIDLMFMLTGIQRVNVGYEMVVNPDFTIGLEQRQFLPEEDWKVFNTMRESGRLQSLPYVHWQRQPEIQAKPYHLRSQKALIRGGNHMRRFILALKLMEIDRLDINSGFFTAPYFQDDMNPQFRYCDGCRSAWKLHKSYPHNVHVKCSCRVPPLSDLGQWNNVSPYLFYRFADDFGVPNASMHLVERLMNARWLSQKEHLEMLARITFTSDLKWLFSIYAPQRFWDAAMVGCVNLLPTRTTDQDYFPAMEADEHYATFGERFSNPSEDTEISESDYNRISRNAKALYDEWMRPSEYSISTNLLRHIFAQIGKHTQ